MNKRNDVEVIINGKQYNMGGYESEEYLQKVASYLNAKYAEFKKQESYLKLEPDVRNVLMQINLADDYFKAKKGQEETAADSEDKSREIADLRRELITLQTKLEAVELEGKTLREENLELQKKLIRLETELEEGKKHS
ncbi:MAG: cell division protein ZapA [Lachnospiraceae bacterium]